MTELTIVLLAWNRPQYLKESLDSITAQTYTNWCLILSDNSSESEAAQTHEALLTAFRQEHPRKEIRYVHRPEPMMVGQHLAAALAEVETPFVAIQSDDDVWMPHHLDQALEWLRQDALHGFTSSEAIIIDVLSQPTGHRLNTVKPPQHQCQTPSRIEPLDAVKN